ncbi:unnamed protein product [Caenorhabditis bovis]|uniref:Uncharacterized protein n=1 Tax=Caenorhabditis bovis TaxID=2654633 RepID=A0A8S1ESW6_9PELO|nr:unnamed protein product [Caenorhabditis bovis]
MTATTSSGREKKFASEPRPPAITKRRDERLKTFRSFDEITESEEEDSHEPMSSGSSRSVSTASERSPYAACDTKETRNTRSFSLTSNPLLSPKTVRYFYNCRYGAPRLSRGFSDPAIRRKTSLPNIIYPEHEADFLALPPIPEATTPASPSSGSSKIQFQ